MAIVNPPPNLRIPANILKDKMWTEYERQRDVILFQLWARTGGSTDSIEDSQQNITSSSSRVSRNAARINSLELKEFDLVDVAENFTTNIKGDEVHVKRRGEEVTIIGNIDGSDDLIINVPLYSVHLIFNGTTWISI